ncbi:hypothetical protein [Staphylospora marina]|uniref:hypothetical protein n=1 Tax=Staphylospora marina TaxID=2490858 RepID=UPI000F5B8F58|nr:hypothetical protein [Staphylospora marina]
MLKDVTLVLFVIFPLISVILGVLFHLFLYNWRFAALVPSFLLPLVLFIDETGFAWSTFQANVDSWFLYGIAYAILSLVSIFVTSAARKKNTE